MTHNLNVTKITQIFDSAEDMTILKTEVKEEIYDCEESVNEMEFMDVKEECIPSFAKNLKEENLQVTKNRGQILNNNSVIGECREVNCQENKYRCGLYHCDFNKEINLKKHYDQCHVAEQKFSNNYVHLKHNNTDKGYQYADCKFSTSIRLNFIKHFRTPKPFKCTFKNCRCTPEQEEFCECDTCEYAATEKSGLKVHVLVKHAVQFAQLNKYKCSKCTYATYRKSVLTRHIRTHIHDRPFKCTYKNCKCIPGQKQLCECDTCEYAAVQENNLRVHILMKHSDEPKRYKCSDCKYATHLKANLEQHIRTHTSHRPFKCTYKNCKCTPRQEESCECDMCEYAATTNGNLKIHILGKHSPQSKNYTCSDCKFASHLKANLEQHIRTHTNDRPFKCTYKNCKCIPGQEEPCGCDMCEYAAISNCKLKSHILIKHSTESKKYRCKDCNYATHMKRCLVWHIRTHTNDKPFKCTYKNCNCPPAKKEFCKCDTCTYATHRKEYLAVHSRIHRKRL